MQRFTIAKTVVCRYIRNYFSEIETGYIKEPGNDLSSLRPNVIFQIKTKCISGLYFIGALKKAEN